MLSLFPDPAACRGPAAKARGLQTSEIVFSEAKPAAGTDAAATGCGGRFPGASGGSAAVERQLAAGSREQEGSEAVRRNIHPPRRCCPQPTVSPAIASPTPGGDGGQRTADVEFSYNKAAPKAAGLWNVARNSYGYGCKA
jgi:hypothetical protein